MDCARGKVLGGSSAINGMVYVRGHAADFDQWVGAGATGWSYADCLPYFKRAERWMGGEDTYRGGEGPVDTCNGNNMRNPLYDAFVAAGEEAGYGKHRGLQRLPAGGLRSHAHDGAARRAMFHRSGPIWRPPASDPTSRW